MLFVSISNFIIYKYTIFHNFNWTICIYVTEKIEQKFMSI